METVKPYRNPEGRFYVIFGTFICLFIFCHTSSIAATMYKWVDADGNVTYQDYPPPTDSRILSESELDELDRTTGSANDVAAEQNPVTLYTTPNCETCDLVRMNLTELRVPFIERKLNTDRAAQQELQDRTGQLVAPSLFMGETRITAFSQEHLRESAVNAGYSVPEVAQAEAADVNTGLLPDTNDTIPQEIPGEDG
jgi:glutaredoxin